MIRDLLVQTEKIFLHGEGDYSYKKLLHDISDLSSGLTQVKGKCVALESENSYDSYVRFLTLLENGCCVFQVPSSHFQDDSFRKFLCSETSTKFIFWGKSEAVPADIDHRGDSHHPQILRARQENEARFIVRTSGSSGKKFKFVLHNPALFIEKFKKVGNHFLTTIAFFPAESIAGIETLLEVLVHQKKLVCAGDRISPAKVADLIRMYRVDYFHTTPSFLNLLVTAGEANNEKLSVLRKIAYGSEPSQRAILEFLKKQIPSINFMHLYGMSEIGIQKTFTEQERPEFFSLEEDLNPSRVAEGKLEVKSLTPMICYLNSEGHVDNEGWFKTLDCVEQEGVFFKVTGRDSDLINLAGRKFFPSEVEELIMQAEGVCDVTIKAVPNDFIGSILVAEIVIGKDVNPQSFRISFRDFCQKKIPSYMHPHKILLKEEAETTTRFKKVRVV